MHFYTLLIANASLKKKIRNIFLVDTTTILRNAGAILNYLLQITIKN